MNELGVASKNITGVPKYGLKLKLNHKYPETWTQGNPLKWSQIWPILPLLFRYLWDYVKRLWNKTKPCMDYLHVLTAKQIYGVPIGGIGTGSIGRGYKGEFCRYQLKPGIYEYNTVDANQFIVTVKDPNGVTIFQSLLSTFKKSGKCLKSWEQLLDGAKCQYTGLYPRAWTEYDLSEYGIKLICRQISPVIPHNYKDSSIPCAVFVWSVENLSDEDRIVTIALTFKNGTSNKSKTKRIYNSKSFSYMQSTGVVLHHVVDDTPCAYILAAKSTDHEVSKCLAFNPNSDGEIPWNQLYKNGRFDKLTVNEFEEECKDIACGIATQLIVGPSNIEQTEICLGWDMPTVSFPFGIKFYNRFYTKHFGVGNATLKIVDYALKNYGKWEEKIDEWQSPVLDDPELPDWYKAALFNETYFISDGGTIWFTLSDDEAEKILVTDPRQKYGRFAYLEGHEYRMYNTYDVHFYASFALAMNWPHLQLSLQYDMKDFVSLEIKESVKMLYDGHWCERKIKNSVPHDIGDPNENPFSLINAYPIHDVSEWRDLNIKFVLQVFRDYCNMNDVSDITKRQYLEDMYETCQTVMTKSLKFDVDNDGVIENSGAPDQTFDTWVMTGTSAYCGGLWLAALYGMMQISQSLNKPQDSSKYKEMLEKGKKSFENKLWNGQYYNFDCSIDCSATVMADQLCGYWYLSLCGHKHDVFPQDKVVSALNTIFKNNVFSYYNGTRGAVNGYKINQGVDLTTIQSEEVWTGVTYALASCLMQEKLFSNAWKTAGGMYNMLTEISGMAFETPEAISAPKYYRSVGYMRPLSIWSMQLAWQQHKNKE